MGSLECGVQEIAIVGVEGIVGVTELILDQTTYTRQLK